MEIQEFFIRSILREIKTSEMVLMPHLISRKILVTYSQIEEKYYKTRSHSKNFVDSTNNFFFVRTLI